MDAALANEFGLETSDVVSEEELLAGLEARLDVLMRKDPLRLLQILYRIDVDERAFEAAMDDANAPGCLARLILQRTHLKAATRAAFRPPPPDDENADLLL
jgi:hypothetical protein